MFDVSQLEQISKLQIVKASNRIDVVLLQYNIKLKKKLGNMLNGVKKVYNKYNKIQTIFKTFAETNQ